MTPLELLDAIQMMEQEAVDESERGAHRQDRVMVVAMFRELRKEAFELESGDVISIDDIPTEEQLKEYE